jgi:hypothetical protein
VGKVHDESKATGKKANFFEQEIAKQKGDPLEEERKRIEREKKLAAQVGVSLLIWVLITLFRKKRSERRELPEDWQN